MSYCKGYKDIAVRRPNLARDFTDASIMNAVNVHLDPDWYKGYEGDRLAYVRHWARVVRREARQRGLL